MTRSRVVTSRMADTDVAAAVEHYATEAGLAVASDFIDALEASLDAVAHHPEIGSPRFALETGIAELRGLALRAFPSVVLYTTDRDLATIVRVLHTSRDIPADLGEGQ